jgi:L-aminopeptidase/D-esterase-like protein
MLSNRRMDSIFEATVFATEEAVINALVAAETMTGRDNHQTLGIPHEQLQQVLRKYGRLEEKK